MEGVVNKFVICFFALLVPFPALGSNKTESRQKSYYSFDKKIDIDELPDRFLIKKKTEVNKEQLELVVGSYLTAAKFEWFNSDICTVIANDVLIDQAIDSLMQYSYFESIRRSYIITSDKEKLIKSGIKPMELGFIDQIIVKFKDCISPSDREDIINKYDLTINSKFLLFESYTVSKDVDIIDIANKLYETGCFEFAYPEQICKITFCDDIAVYPNDTYFQNQISLHNVGQTFNGHTGTIDADIDAPEAWALTMGSEDIVIAVIDRGVTSDHPDLPNSRQVRLNGSNFGSGDINDPSPTNNQNHGNACAGIIAATANNNEGITGIAPLCKIMPVRTDESSTCSQIANAILFANTNGANIISNSWGYNTTINDFSPAIIYAMEYVTDHNSLILFAAGNTASHVNGNDGYVMFPANHKMQGMLTIGASDRNDQQSDYSPTDTCIDIVAPSHKAYPYTYNPDNYSYTGIPGENLDMWTIDIPGNSGYNPWPSDQPSYITIGYTLPDTGTNYLSYTGLFGGTSYACPVVAGVAALVLSMNPELSPQNVCNVLTSSADKVGGYTYNTNGKCDQMGYGRVNANNAVWMVCDTTFYVNKQVNTGVNTVVGCDIYMENVVIHNNATLKVRPRNDLKIDNRLYVAPNSVLDIRHY